MVKKFTQMMKPAAALMLLMALVFARCYKQDGPNPLGSNQVSRYGLGGNSSLIHKMYYQRWYR